MSHQLYLHPYRMSIIYIQEITHPSLLIPIYNLKRKTWHWNDTYLTNSSLLWSESRRTLVRLWWSFKKSWWKIWWFAKRASRGLCAQSLFLPLLRSQEMNSSAPAISGDITVHKRCVCVCVCLLMSVYIITFYNSSHIK